MKPSDDRLDATACNELNQLLARHMIVRISPACGVVGNEVEVRRGLAHGHPVIGEGRSHDLSKAMHRAFVAVEEALTEAYREGK